jgi:NarL family two-component system response regulator LiaR
MTTPITVLVVDDHEIVRHGIRGFLAAHGDIVVVGEADSGAEAVRLAEELVPDVILMDLLMPGMEGVEATGRIHRLSPRSQIVVLTSYHDDSHIFPAIKAGASSYLLKDIAPDALVAAVRAAARGEPTLHPHVAARLIQETRAPHGAPGPAADLTAREEEVLRLIAEGLSNAEIAERLVLSEKTVKGHVSNILAKLHLADRTQAAVFAWREGVVGRQPATE